MKSFQKRKLLAVSMAVALFASALAGCGGSEKSNGTADGESAPKSAKAEYTWKVALNTAPGDILYEATTKFCEEVEANSNGRIKTEIFPGGVLGTGRELLEGLAFGAADVYVESVGTLAPFSEKANIDAMPYLYSGYDHFINTWHSDIGEEMRETIGEEAGFKLLGGMYRGARITTSSKQITDLAGMKGFKLRAPGLDSYIKTWQWIGATPTPLAITETYTAIQQGTVEGQENPIIECYNYGFYDVCPYFINTNHVYSQDVFIMDRTKFESLPEDIQTIVADAANAASEYRNEKMTQAEADAKAKLEEKGVTFIDVDTQEFIKAYDGFVDKEFPYLSDWANKIKAQK